MRWAAPLTVLAACAAKVAAADSFTGTSNFYVYALPKSEQEALLQGMSDAGMKVLRTFVQGVSAGQKGSDNTAVPDVEANGIGQYDDTILNAIDDLMVLAQGYGVKLLIAMYDKNTLAAGGPYNEKYTESGFYTSSEALSDYENRITYILNTHKNAQANNQPWSELSEYIFGYDVMNEPMINQGADFFEQNLDWVCNVAQQIRGNVGDPNQLILTGGNSAGVSIQDRFFDSDCPVDVIAVHDYTDGYDSYLPSAITQANTAGKKIVIEEWGSLVGDGRDSNLQSNVQKMNQYGVPWIYWELITNTDPGQGQDYEIDVGGADWSTLQPLAQSTEGTTCAFDFSASL